MFNKDNPTNEARPTPRGDGRDAPPSKDQDDAATRKRRSENDRVEIASVDSFPCSDAPGYGSSHA